MNTLAETDLRAAEAHAFLSAMYGDVHVGYGVLWVLPSRTSQCFSLAESNALSAMADVAIQLSAQSDVYLAVCPTSCAVPADERGTAAQAMVVPGVWEEIDVKEGAFPTFDDALEFARSGPLPPSLIVRSGSGVHVYRLFKEPIVLETADEMREIGSLVRRWQAMRRRQAGAQGASLDFTGDLARVLRVPGTVNYKTGTPQPVALIHEDPAARYTVADFEDVLPDDSPDDHGAPPVAAEGVADLTEQQMEIIVETIHPFWIDGVRHRFSLLVSGWLATNGISEPSAREVVRRCSHRCGDREPEAKQRNVGDTYGKLRSEIRPAGWGGLRDMLPADVGQTLHNVLASHRVSGRNGYKPSGNGVASSPEADRPLPRICAQNQNIPEVSAVAWEALEVSNNPVSIVQYGDVLSRIVTDQEGNPRIREVTEGILAHELARAATWWRSARSPHAGGLSSLAARVPRAVVEDMLAARTYPVPPLVSVVRIPTFAGDGTLEDQPGYHPKTRSYYAPQQGVTIPPVPAVPGTEDVAKAKGLIDELLADFPFAGEAERAHAICLMLELTVRNLIDGPTPLRLIEAPVAGSGKGLLADALLIPSIGGTVAVMPAASSDDEWRKKITSQLMNAPAVILIDNVTSSIDSGSLAAALTSPTFTDRQLGRNKMVELPVRCLWVATANNPTMSTEIARRTVRIRLDPGMDKPWERSGFRHDDLRVWVYEHRGWLIWASLVLVRHWLAQGSRPGNKRLGSYESWSRVMGGILAAAGIDGFLTNLAEFYEASDLEGAAWTQFVEAWAATFGEVETSAAELFPLAEPIGELDFGLGSERAQRTAFGIALIKYRDRVIGDYRIVLTRTVQHANRWRLLRIRGASSFDTALPIETGEPCEPT